MGVEAAKDGDVTRAESEPDMFREAQSVAAT